MSIVDRGDTDAAPGDLPEPFGPIEISLTPRERLTPLGIGGEHSIALPELRLPSLPMHPHRDPSQATAPLATTTAAESFALIAARGRDTSA